jgi:hypothetical protein
MMLWLLASGIFSLMRWEDVPKIPDTVDGVTIHVRAPACPVNNTATWRQLFVSVALIVLMGWLAIAAFTSEPISWVPALLALVGVAGGIFMLAGGIRSRMERKS